MGRHGGTRVGRLVLGGALVLGSLAVVPATSAAQSTAWSITQLKPLPGHTASSVADVNNDGVAVGWSIGGPSAQTGIETAPVVWDEDGDPTALPEPVSGAGAALAINDEGDIVGEVRTAPSVGVGATKAVLWTPGDEGYEATLLGDGSARDINDSGLIVGAIPVPLQGAAIFEPGEDPVPLPSTAGKFASADRVNAGGVIIGSDDLEPVAWANGTKHELYKVLDAFEVEVKDVTDTYFTLGRITVSGRALGFAQAPGGAIFPLTANTSKASAATDMNNIGIAVGGAGDGLNGSYAALFVYGSVVPIELVLSAADQEDWELFPAVSALNDSVTIVGNGKKDGGPNTAWMISPPA